MGGVGDRSICVRRERGVQLPRRLDGGEIRPHALGQSGQERSAQRRGLLIERATHRDPELIGLHLQHEVHHGCSAVDA